MKLLKKLWGAGLLALLLITAVPQQSAAQDDYISEQEFYDELEPYGTWVYDPQYGNIWVPDVEEDFRPYGSRGHWVLTEYGNTWVSDYPWGWATFHYGRWRFDDYYGWVWIPGYEWAPAWVSWRHGGGYYGWAPLMPGISISLSFGSGYRVPDNYWAFAPERYINQPNIYNYYVPHTRVVNIINRTTIINNTYVRDNRRYIAGPRIADIQRVTRREPQVYAINNARRPGTINVQNNTVNIFRPAVRQNNNAKPTRVVNGTAYRQQNPNESIARRGNNAGYNRANADKLKEVARSTNSNNSVVRINPRTDNGNNEQPGRRPTPREQGVDQPGNRRGQRENRPNVNPSVIQDSQSEQAKKNEADRQKAEQLRQRGIKPAQDETQEEAWQRRNTDRSMTQATRDGLRRQQRANEQQVKNGQAQKKREERAQQQAQQQQQRRQNEQQQRDQQKQQADQQQRQLQQTQRDEQRKQQDAQRQQQAQQQQQTRRDQQRQQQVQPQQTQRKPQRQQQVQPQQNQQQRGGEQRQQRRPPQQ